MKAVRLGIVAIAACLSLMVWRVEVNAQGKSEEHKPALPPGKDKPGGSGDLAVFSVTAPASVTRGSQAAVSDVITNKATLYGAGISVACLYLNTTPTITGAANLGTHTTVTLAPKGKTTWSGNVNIPANQPTGQNYYIVVTDCQNQVIETDENNNTNSTPVTVN